MTVERYKWNCPGCGQTFGIKKGTTAPSLCPECAKKPQAATPPEAVRPASEIQEKTVEFTIPELPAIAEEPNFLQGLSSTETSPIISPRKSSRRQSRQKYPALRVISTIFQVIALLILVGSGFGTIVAVTQKVEYWIAGSIFANGVIVALVFAAFGEIIKVAIDIEANTRDR